MVNAFQPVAGIFFAYLILNEIPELGQYVGGMIIMIGIGIFTKLRELREKEKVGYKKPRSFSGV